MVQAATLMACIIAEDGGLGNKLYRVSLMHVISSVGFVAIIRYILN